MDDIRGPAHRNASIERKSVPAPQQPNIRMYKGGQSAPARPAGPGAEKQPARPGTEKQPKPAASAKPRTKKKVVDFSIPQKFDFSFFLIVIILLTFGLVMLVSATYASAKVNYGDSYYFIKRQLIFAAVGLAAMFIISFIDYHILFTKVVLKAAIIIGIGMMLLVQFAGTTVNGAGRWLSVGEIAFQPSEVLKFITIMVRKMFW